MLVRLDNITINLELEAKDPDALQCAVAHQLGIPPADITDLTVLTAQAGPRVDRGPGVGVGDLDAVGEGTAHGGAPVAFSVARSAVGSHRWSLRVPPAGSNDPAQRAG